MFKGYGKVNSILHEKLNSLSEIKNMTSNNFQKSQDLNIIEKNKKKAESAGNLRKYNNHDFTEEYNLDGNYNNFEEMEKSVNLNEYRSIRENENIYIDPHNMDNIENSASPFNEKYNARKSIEENSFQKSKISQKKNKKRKSDIDLTNALQLHVDHFPKPNYKTVKMRDQVTDMPEETKSNNLFLTQKNSEINSSEGKKKLIKDLKTKHNISYISDISQVNQIKFFAFEVKNPGHKEHFNNKIVQIEKEILKEIDQINKEQGKNYNAELEKTENFFDLDKSKVFDFTKRHKSASNPNYYGRPTSKQNFKTNPGLIRGFLRNFKNNKLLSEFFKYKREKDKRERFNLQSNDFSSSQIFRNANSNSNSDYVETYYIGKNLKAALKNPSLTQNEFYQKNELEKMKKYFDMIRHQRINEEDELKDLNNLNQDLYINKDFIKEFNEYALKFARGEIGSKQIPNFNDNLLNQYNYVIGLNKNAENKINLNADLKENLTNKLDIIRENKEFKGALHKDPIDNLVTQIYHSNNSQKSNLSPKADFLPGSPPYFQFNSHLKQKKKSKKIPDSEKLDEKYLEENFYEESIDEDETKKVMLKINEPKFNKIGSFVKEKEKGFFRQITNNEEPHNSNPNYDKDAKFLDNLNIISKNLKNKNPFKNLAIKAPNNIEVPNKNLDNEIQNKKKRKSKIKSIDKESLQPTRNSNLNEAQDINQSEVTNEKNLVTNNNTQRNIKTFTNENQTEILQSGLSYEENNKNTKQEEAQGLFENEENNGNNPYEDYYPKNLEHNALYPPSFIRANLQGKNSSNSIYDNFHKRNKILSKNKNYVANSIQNDYYKPISNKISKNNLRNIQKNKFNRLKDIVFGSENEEHKQKMIKDTNAHLNNIFPNANSNNNKKPTTAPAIKKTKSPLRSLINNQMGLIIKNHNIY